MVDALTLPNQILLIFAEWLKIGCTAYTDDASAIARRAQTAHGTFPERGSETNSLPYIVRSAGRCSEGSYDVIGCQ
ncbi:hypothetical protein EVAR_87089_1 [Eumeta japonica]|uniref:Uncharacterized protein n=1 Tax=Eumeta variegata TaxID=151549 RepID=A0A4C1VNW9_EUMVA|nr:hypothetical protein EVAR_87089_1 [Eumeta japonica]